jgi:hypothetical protein
MSGPFLSAVFDPDTMPEEESAIEEVERLAKARRCRCGELIRGLRALHGRKFCSGRCAERFK